MQSIQQKIIEKLPEYSKNQKKLANFIVENLKMVPLLSVSQVAERSGISTATVVRFVRLIGFNGYLDFRNELSSILKEELSPLERYKKSLDEKRQDADSFLKVADKVIDNIHLSLEQNDRQVLKHIVSHIHQANNIYCIGMGISHYLAEILAYLLKLYMKNAFALSNDSPSLPEQIILMKPEDLLMVFSFPPYSRPTVEAAKQASDLKVPVISFTDSPMAPIGEYCEHILIARTDNILFANSIGAISVLMNALVTELAFTEEKKVMDGLEKIEDYLKDKRYFF